jgi:hypothetical protein
VQSSNKQRVALCKQNISLHARQTATPVYAYANLPRGLTEPPLDARRPATGDSRCSAGREIAVSLTGRPRTSKSRDLRLHLPGLAIQIRPIALDNATWWLQISASYHLSIEARQAIELASDAMEVAAALRVHAVRCYVDAVQPLP